MRGGGGGDRGRGGWEGEGGREWAARDGGGGQRYKWGAHSGGEAAGAKFFAIGECCKCAPRH